MRLFNAFFLQHTLYYRIDFMCEMLFSQDVLPNLRVALCDLLGVQERPGVGKYLGLPSFNGRNKNDIFHYVKDRIWKKISSWRGKTMSMAGMEILILREYVSHPDFSQ